MTFNNDVADRVETTVDALGDTTTTAYDTQGNVIEQTRSLGNDHHLHV